jgi:KRAB domain-containing zinc finger protein
LNYRRSHTGEKPFKCGICDIKYSDGSTLLKHKYSLHPEIMIAACSKCDRKYENTQKLEVHMKKVHKIYKINS